MLESICRTAGIAVGLYTSPHLVSITERIKIGGDEISKDAFARFATEVRLAAEHLVTSNNLEALPTFFEHVTAIALLAFREAGVELAILETGLGGRLDATTAVRAETVAITPISLDHQEYLGETLSEVAAEKAAIIRPGVTAIIATQPTAALNVIMDRCREVGVEATVAGFHALETGASPLGLFTVTFETAKERYQNVHLSLRGRHQIANAGLAIQLAEALRPQGFAISPADIISGIECTRHAGRLTDCDSILLDGAHNPDAARVLRDYLDEFVSQPLTLIFGAMSDKKLTDMAAVLFPGVNRLILTQPDNPRAASVESLQILAEPFLRNDNVFVAPNVKQAIKIAREVTPQAGLICVTGSLYLVGEVAKIVDQLA
jgi:dihydrofolate synthase/folylpolyglutamate synthase